MLVVVVYMQEAVRFGEMEIVGARGVASAR